MDSPVYDSGSTPLTWGVSCPMAAVSTALVKGLPFSPETAACIRCWFKTCLCIGESSSFAPWAQTTASASTAGLSTSCSLSAFTPELCLVWACQCLALWVLPIHCPLKKQLSKALQLLNVHCLQGCLWSAGEQCKVSLLVWWMLSLELNGQLVCISCNQPCPLHHWLYQQINAQLTKNKVQKSITHALKNKQKHLHWVLRKTVLACYSYC